MSNCSGFSYPMDYDEWKELRPDKRLCRCPNCKGFLPSNFPMDKPFICKKCGTELLVFFDHDEDTGEELECGRICTISGLGIEGENK